MIHGGYMTKPTELTKQRVKQYKLWTLVNNGFISGLLILTYKPHKYEGSPSRNANSKVTIVKISVNQPASQPASQYLFRINTYQRVYMPDSLVGIRGNKNNHDRHCICFIEFKF